MGMRSLRIPGKIAHQVAEAVFDTMRVQDGPEEFRSLGPKGHGGIARGDLHASDDEFRHVRDEALEEGRGEGRPDEPLGNAGVGRSEGVQVRIGLPLLEQEFNLPSETVEFADGGEIEVLAR